MAWPQRTACGQADGHFSAERLNSGSSTQWPGSLRRAERPTRSEKLPSGLVPHSAANASSMGCCTVHARSWLHHPMTPRSKVSRDGPRERGWSVGGEERAGTLLGGLVPGPDLCEKWSPNRNQSYGRPLQDARWSGRHLPWDEDPRGRLLRALRPEHPDQRMPTRMVARGVTANENAVRAARPRRRRREG